MCDREDHNLFLPENVGEVVLLEPWCEIHPAHIVSPDIVEQRIVQNGLAMLQVGFLKGKGQCRINGRIVADRIMKLLQCRRVDFPLRHAGRRWMPSSEKSASVRRSASSPKIKATFPSWTSLT